MVIIVFAGVGTSVSGGRSWLSFGAGDGGRYCRLKRLNSGKTRLN